MRIHRFHITALLIVVGLTSLNTGCSSTSRRNPLGDLSLPSPWATVKASEKEQTKTSATRATPGKKNAPTSEADSQIALDLLRARGMENAGDYDKARKIYESLRKSHPDNLDVVHRLGVVADAQRRHGEAEGMFLYVLARDPRNAEVLSDLGYCYYLQGQLTKAESAILKAATIEPENELYHNNLGLVVGQQGRYDEALEYFQQGGPKADAYFNLAFVYASRDEAAKAKECFMMALSEDPTHANAREALRSFEEFERLPEHLREADDVDLAGGRVRYVPYFEGQEKGSRDVQTAGMDVPLPTSGNASRTTRALQMQSRGMLNRNLQSQRNESVGEFESGS
jgi:tetratricopeptide (TPR) repeat protein